MSRSGDSTSRAWRWPAVLVPAALVLLAGCAAPRLVEPDPPPLEHRAETQSQGQITVTAAALGPQESRERFGAGLHDVGVQPVWLRISNGEASPYLLFALATDRDYFSPMEVARRVGGRSADPATVARLRDGAMPIVIEPGAVAEGFIYGRTHEGLKAITVQLVGQGVRHDFPFVLPVPGLARPPVPTRERLYPAETLPDLDDTGLRHFVEALPCCAAHLEGTEADPVNFVLVGPYRLARLALASRGWSVAEVVSGGAAMRMTWSFLFGGTLANAPVSDLVLFGRAQDVAFEKARETVAERNHLRLWLAPVTWRGQSVWAGQISRDIAVKLSGRFWPPTTHEIDPDVDDARFYLVQDLLASRRVARVAFVGGVGAAPRHAPRRNAEDDPYFTDGRRAVFFLSEAPVDHAELDLVRERLGR